MTMGEIIQIEQQIKNLKERKIQIQNEIKKEKDLKKKENNNKCKNFPNVLKRISTKFCMRIDKINDRREENGFDKISRPKITELIIRHKLFPEIEKDIIHFDISLENNGGILND